MFNPMAPREATSLEKAIDELIEEMRQCDSGAEEKYSKLADELVKLYKLKEVDSKQRISADTLALISGNILGIVLIVGHERAHVVTSKAFSFVQKLR